MKRLLFLVSFLCVSPFAIAQSQYALITATNISDAAGNKISSGTITFTPVNNAGTPIAPQKTTSGGRVVPKPVTFKVVNGAISTSYGTAQLVDVTQAYPSDFCYKDTIHDNISGNTWSTDSCLQPAYNASWCSVSSGVTTCNFDNYSPAIIPGVAVAAPTLTGGTWTTGAAGSAVSCTVSLAGMTPNYTLSCSIPQGHDGATQIVGLTGDGKGNVNISGNLGVGGALTFAGKLDVGGGLHVHGSMGSPSALANFVVDNAFLTASNFTVFDSGKIATRNNTLDDGNGNARIAKNLFASTMNSWARNVCSYDGALYPTHGDKVNACNADAVAAGGGICDSRCIDGTTTETTGTAPIVIGSSTARVMWLLPSSGALNVTNHGTTLPTPAAPTVATSITSGVVPAATYYVKIAYASGGGTGIASPETAINLTAVGELIVTTPPAVAYAYSYDIYLSTTSGAETWVRNCPLTNATCTIAGNQYSSTPVPSFPSLTAPTVATGVPAIIVDGSQRSGMRSDSSGRGFALKTDAAMNVSNVVATEGIGSPFIENMFFGNYLGTGTVKESMILVKGAYSETNINNIYTYGLPGAPVMEIRSVNDIKLSNVDLHCNGQAGCSLLWFSERAILDDDSDNNHNITFDSLLLEYPASNSAMVKIDGNPGGTGDNYHFSHQLVFDNVALENSGNATGVIGFDVKDARGIEIRRPSFEYGSSDYIPVRLAESNDCIVKDIRISGATLATPGGTGIFVENTITGESISPNTGWDGYEDYVWGSDSDATCNPTTEYVRGKLIDADASSVGGNAATAIVASGPSAFSSNILLNPDFELGTVSTVLPTDWTSHCGTGLDLVTPTCAYTWDATTYHSSAHAEKLTIGTAGYAEIYQTGISAVAGQSYMFSAWVKGDGTAGMMVRLQLTDTATGKISYCTPILANVTSAWTNIYGKCTSTVTGTAEIHLTTYSHYGAYGIAGSIWMDDVLFGPLVSATYPVFGLAASSPDTLTINNTPCTLGGRCTVSGDGSSSIAAPASATLLGSNSSGALVDASSATLSNNTTGTAANITATTNSTLTSLPALTSASGGAFGTAAYTASGAYDTAGAASAALASAKTYANSLPATLTINSTLCTLGGNCTVPGGGSSSLTVPASATLLGSDASGTLVDKSSATLSNNTTGTAANVTATSNSTLTALSALTTASGGAFGSAAFTASSAYDAAGAASTAQTNAETYANSLFPRVVASVTLTDQAVSIASTKIFTATAAGLYKMTAALRTTTAGTAGTVSVSINYSSSGSLSLTNLGYTTYAETYGRLLSGESVPYTTTVTSNTGGTYTLDVVIEQLK